MFLTTTVLSRLHLFCVQHVPDQYTILEQMAKTKTKAQEAPSYDFNTETEEGEI